MLTLPGYQTLDSIYESANSVVYRGRREKDNRAVILKRLKEDYPTAAELTRYKSEYEIARSLNVEGAVKAYSLESYHKSPVLILEDFGGLSLKMLNKSRKFTLAEVLQICIATADSLGHIHAANIVHKDINPANIVFNPETGKLKIIDFGLSTQLTRENPTLKNPNVLEGTLAYMSPEQTGRMNRSMDYRTDFYSLGVTFYELLTNQLPFIGEDAMELVHCHIAKVPVPPHEMNANIPKAVSDIVMKLLAKTAEERYQSAWGIKADLEECLKQLQAKGEISEFPLCRGDISDKFQIPQKLYGREREVEILLSAMERVGAGTTEMMLVSGYSGIGKSALVQEIYKPITRQRGYFIAGKFDQFQRNIPYSALVGALRSLIRQLLAETESQLARYKEKLLAAFGPNGQIITDVIPEVELIVGKQPDVQELGPAEAQNRFNLVFQNFIRVFCSAEHPLVIFLDDLQWADSATLKLIEVMMTDEEIRYLLAIGAYRDNEVDASHPLMMTLEGLRKKNAIVNNITLAPLAIAHVTHLIAETLQRDISAVQSLAELVVRKTQGNPFFVNQFLKTLYQENLLTFNPPTSGSKGGWKWDIAQIEAMGLTDNVVELTIQKLKKLPEATQQVLRLAACAGNTFDLTTLSIIYEKPPAVTFKDLLPAIQEGLILPTSELETTGEEVINSSLVIQTYKFLHDRVQQSGYALIDEKQQTAVHLQIGRLLLANISPEQRAERVFEIADHLNSGRKLIADDGEKVELVLLNLTAARKAKDATAYAAARNYLRIGLEIFPGDIWEERYELAFSLHKELADVEYLNGNFEESEALIKLAGDRAKSNLEKAEVYNTLIVQYTLLTKYEEAIQSGLKALRLLGIELAEEDLTGAVSAELAEAQANLANKKIASLINEEKMKDPAKKVALKLLGHMGPLTFFSSQELWKLTVIKAINLSLKYGFVAGGSYCYSCYGIILNSILGDYQSAYEFGRLAIALSENSNNLSQNCQDSVIFANYLNCWVKPIKTTAEINSEGYKVGLQSGNLQWTGYNRMFQTITYFFQGMNLSSLLDDIANSLAFCHQTKNLWSIDIIIANKLAILSLMGEKDETSEEQHIGNFQQRKSMAALCEFYVLKAQTLYMFERNSEALKASDRASEIIDFLMGHISSAHHNFYRSLILASLCLDVGTPQREDYWKQLEANQKQLKIWADNCPESFAHKYWLVAAEMARIAGRDLEAMDLYDRAIKSAGENDFIQNEALAAERAAKFWLAKGKEDFAQLYMAKAHYGYRIWGAKRKVEDLEQKYAPLLVKTQINAGKSMLHNITVKSATATSNGRDLGAALDLATVMKASQAISGEIVLSKLLAQLMKIAIQNAGAQKGLLILEKEGKLLIEAQGEVDAEVRGLQGMPVESCQQLPRSVINYVARTLENVVLSDATREGTFTTDPYIVQQKPKSVLCTPIVHQGKLSGILYLENNLSVGAFTPDRLEVLQILSSQAAISIENARLYNDLAAANATLEAKVQERTQQLKEKNEHLQKAEEAALAASRAKSEFLANMSHELRTPLNGILGYAQILRLDRTLTELQKNNIGIIQQCGEHLLTLINDVLDLSKIEARKMELYPSDFRFREFLEVIVEICSIRAEQKGISLTYEPLTQLPTIVHADEKRLRQVLINLLGNAVKFTSEGGVIFKVGYHDGKIRFWVEDTGVGMAPEHLKELFQPFKQVGDRERKTEGTGLGLAISRQFVQLMGGDIYVKSTLNQGSVFYFDLDLPEVLPGGTVGKLNEGAIAGFKGDKRKILVVDDKWENRAVLVGMLQPLGFEMAEAFDGEDCLQKAAEFQPDCILMDLMMPGMDGFEATKRLKSEPKFASVVAIATSASVFDFDRKKSKEAGCDDFLPKPVRAEELLEMLRLHLHLEWITEDKHKATKKKESPETPTSIASSIVAPGTEEIDILFDLAMKGDLKGIEERIANLERLDSQFKPFVTELRQFIAGFQSKKIRDFLRKYKESR